MVSHNFQPVVLAGGRGTRYPDIVNSKPKCLIPIGPYPMLWYPLNMLQNHGFTDTIVIVLESQKSEVQQALEKCPLKIKTDYVSIPTDTDFGTADALRYVKDKIKAKSDIIIVPCDVITDVQLFPLLKIFRQHDASVAIQLFYSVHVPITVPGPKAKHKSDRDLIGIHPETQRLLFLASTSDFEENLVLSAHRLRKSGQMLMYSNLVDSHIYVMKRWILDFIVGDEFLKSTTTFSTIKGELLPYIVKKQMSRPEASMSDRATSDANVNLKGTDIFQFVSLSEANQRVTETSVFNDSLSKNAYNSEKIRCYVQIAPKGTFGIRANNMIGYCTANQKIFSILESINPEIKEYLSPTAVIKSTQFSNNAVGDNTFISEKTSIKGTIFGANCKINPKTRITDSILMNNVTIEEGVVIENCIICDKATILKGSVLKQCLIGSNFTVEENTTKEKAHLTTDDGFMEIE